MTTAFRHIQTGLESTRGTPVAADKVLEGTLTVTPSVVWHRPVDERNSLAEFRRAVAVATGTRLRYDGDATYEHLIDFLSMAIQGAISPSTVETTGRVWDFVPNTVTKNVQDSFTFEYGDEVQFWEVPFTICENIELGFTLGEVVSLRADMFGQLATKTTKTAALSEIAVNEIVANHMKVYIDSSWANLGNTEVAALVSGASVRLPTGLRPSNRADGSLNMATVSESKTHLEVDLDLINSTEAITEYDAAIAGTDRAVRLEVTGGIAVGSTPYLLIVDCIGKWVGEPEMFGDRDGENTFRLSLNSHEDSGGNHFRMEVTNLITAL